MMGLNKSVSIPKNAYVTGGDTATDVSRSRSAERAESGCAHDG